MIERLGNLADRFGREGTCPVPGNDRRLQRLAQAAVAFGACGLPLVILLMPLANWRKVVASLLIALCGVLMLTNLRGPRTQNPLIEPILMVLLLDLCISGLVWLTEPAVSAMAFFFVFVAMTPALHARAWMTVEAVVLASLSYVTVNLMTGAGHARAPLADDAVAFMAFMTVGLVSYGLVRLFQQERAALEQTYLSALHALAAALDAKDSYTERHSHETAGLSVRVGRALKLDPTHVRLLEWAAILHDIGKIGIPGELLNKPTSLTPEERAVMETHPMIGEKIVAQVGPLSALAPIIRAEHEHFDGTGYPDGLRGQQIPLEARIVHVCDAYHAMTSDRSYRKAMPVPHAIAQLIMHRGHQFDPVVVDTLLAVIRADSPVSAPQRWQERPLAAKRAA